MKRVFCVSLLLIAVAAFAVAQQSSPTQSNTVSMSTGSSMQSNTSNTTGNPANESSIFQNEKNLWEAWKNHNAQVFQQNISQNAVDVSGSGVRTGKQQVVQDLTSGNCQVNNYSLADQKFNWYDQNTVLLTYRADQDATCGGNKLPSTVWASTLWVNKGGKWEAAFHQETPSQQQNPPQQQPR